MKLTAIFVILFVVARCSWSQDTAGSVQNSQKLLLILTDGFRWDYEQKYNLENFARLSREGVKAGYFFNDYPTLSYPNYYSIMTGLHVESHDMSGNYMYDKVRNEYFLIGSNPEQFNAHWWNSGEPIWITAVKQNATSYLWYMPGCEVEIRDSRPTFCDTYTTVPTSAMFTQALDEAMAVLTNGTTNLAVVYHEQPDDVGHRYGPDSPEVGRAVRDIDTQVGGLLNRIKQESQHQINLIVLSDHGMTSISQQRVINISTVLDPDDYITIMENGALAYIYVSSDDKIQPVYDALDGFHPNMKCYKKMDIPSRLFLKGGEYVSEITCMADLGWVILQPFDKFVLFPRKSDGRIFRGTHGFDNVEEDMRGIFYAFGPYFRPGARVNYLRAIDPYNVMCQILNLNPAPNNGSASRVQPLKATPSGAPAFHSPQWLIIYTVAAQFIVIGLFGRREL